MHHHPEVEVEATTIAITKTLRFLHPIMVAGITVGIPITTMILDTNSDISTSIRTIEATGINNMIRCKVVGKENGTTTAATIITKAEEEEAMAINTHRSINKDGAVVVVVAVEGETITVEDEVVVVVDSEADEGVGVVDEVIARDRETTMRTAEDIGDRQGRL